MSTSKTLLKKCTLSAAVSSTPRGTVLTVGAKNEATATASEGVHTRSIPARAGNITVFCAARFKNLEQAMCFPLNSSIPNVPRAMTVMTDKVFKGRDSGGGQRIVWMISILIYLLIFKRKKKSSSTGGGQRIDPMLYRDRNIQLRVRKSMLCLSC